MNAESEPSRIRGFPPIVGPEPRVLVLGTAPSEVSLKEGQYYAHPRNDFWPIMERLFSGGRPLVYAERVEMLKQAGVALWDVLRQADRVGSLDSNIKKPVPNDIGGLLHGCPSIRTVFFNGAAAERLFSTQVSPSLKNSAVRFVGLPSTSPANATISFALELAAWDAVRVAATAG
jgi:TDG/mug DNA glycosylase family protein